ncbi:hypothetical protein H2O64_08835 [Kordia sp. YSTF-M3]|uniref:Lipoprotein n=1 Tax=Kordia aestuariivivens TaxID=2759037 RepID=A0ABR7Q8X2_9FLAO|nr:hypothetical protein [Kordia aestuariivivens]MBC8754774.1 hypothetical protein [Kordia aestuariivivens]
MKKYIFLLVGMIICACATSKKTAKPKLPPMVTCAENAKIYDRDSEFEINKLTTLDSLSYTTTYTRMYMNTDSLERNEIRFRLGKVSTRVVAKLFPEIEFTDASISLNKTYNDILLSTNRIKKGGATREYFEKLIVPSTKSNLQLFVELKNGTGDGIFVNHVSIFVIDIKNYELKYYDYILYKCDPRDEIMFMKTLYYGLNKLKKSIE